MDDRFCESRMEDFLMPATGETNPIPEVHGNQVGLLELSKCFRSSIG